MVAGPARRRYAPQCTRLLSQYKTITKVLGDQVPSLDAFVSEYRVRQGAFLTLLWRAATDSAAAQMDCTAAAQRLKIGVPATVEHSAQEGSETAKGIAETTQVCCGVSLCCHFAVAEFAQKEFHHTDGRSQTQHAR